MEANSLQYLKSHILARDLALIYLPGSTGAPSGQEAAAQEKIFVNFKSELRDIIKETKYLDRMNFMVPEAALNVALQVC